MKTYPTLIPMGSGHRIVEQTAAQRGTTEAMLDFEVAVKAMPEFQSAQRRNNGVSVHAFALHTALVLNVPGAKEMVAHLSAREEATVRARLVAVGTTMAEAAESLRAFGKAGMLMGGPVRRGMTDTIVIPNVLKTGK